ncbi:damage-inducible type I toxin DinQ, partial [Escherichia coli]
KTFLDKVLIVLKALIALLELIRHARGGNRYHGRKIII